MGVRENGKRKKERRLSKERKEIRNWTNKIMGNRGKGKRSKQKKRRKGGKRILKKRIPIAQSPKLINNSSLSTTTSFYFKYYH